MREIPTQFHQTWAYKWRTLLKMFFGQILIKIARTIGRISAEIWGLSCAKVWKSCRSLQKLSKEHLLAKNWRRYNRERACQCLEVIQFIYPFASVPNVRARKSGCMKLVRLTAPIRSTRSPPKSESTLKRASPSMDLRSSNKTSSTTVRRMHGAQSETPQGPRLLRNERNYYELWGEPIW
jgi:hypothetical protein